MKGPSDAPPTPASTPPPEKESEIIEIDNEDEPTPATVNSTLDNGQLISKCPFGVFKSRISALVSKKRSNQKNKGTLYFIKFSKTVFYGVNLVSQCLHLEVLLLRKSGSEKEDLN